MNAPRPSRNPSNDEWETDSVWRPLSEAGSEEYNDNNNNNYDYEVEENNYAKNRHKYNENQRSFMHKIRMQNPHKVVHFRKGGFNTIINFVPQQEAWVIERMGRFHKILEPGVAFLIPCVDNIQYIHTLKEMTIEIPQQEAITLDNVQLDLDAVLYVRVVDPYKASYGVQDPEFAVSQLAMTVMRSEVGKLMLDNVFRERANLNLAIVEGIKDASAPWGMVCLRYEIRTMNMPPEIQRAMKLQVEAERKKRALILESEGMRQAEMNKAEGEKQSRILRSEAATQETVNKGVAAAKAAESEKLQRILESEAEMQTRINMAKAEAEAAESQKIQKILASEAAKQAEINRAQGQAQAIQMEMEARCKALEGLSLSLEKSGGQAAASFITADNYVKAFSHLAKTNNTIIIPNNPTDVGSMVAQAMTIYNNVSHQKIEKSKRLKAIAQNLMANGNTTVKSSPNAITTTTSTPSTTSTTTTTAASNFTPTSTPTPPPPIIFATPNPSITKLSSSSPNSTTKTLTSPKVETNSNTNNKNKRIISSNNKKLGKPENFPRNSKQYRSLSPVFIK